MKKFWVVVITVLYIAGCASPTPIPTATPLPSPSPSPLPTFTPTPLPTETPQPTQTPVVEKDLSPIFTENISQEFLDVQITTKLITDESLSVSNPSITKISINPNFYNLKGEKSEVAIADFMARMVFKVWWHKGEVDHKGSPTEDDFKAFMVTWSEAQKGSDPELWKKVQFSIFANDLSTQGYTQEKTTIWPMFTGNQAIDRVKAIKEINIVFVRGPRVKNITLKTETGSTWGNGYGANIEDDNLFIYVGLVYGANNPANTANLIIGGMSNLPWFLIKNTGSSTISGYQYDKELEKLLSPKTWGRWAIKIYPPSDNEKRYNP